MSRFLIVFCRKEGRVWPQPIRSPYPVAFNEESFAGHALLVTMVVLDLLDATSEMCFFLPWLVDRDVDPQLPTVGFE